MNKKFWSKVSLLLLASVIPVNLVASAYAVQLNAVGLVTPKGGFDPRTNDRKDLGKKFDFEEFDRIDFRSTVTKTTKIPLSVNSETFLNRWITTVSSHKNAMLWSAYPAAIRGQVFSNSPPGGSPLQTGGW